jgi:hypothetical protein
MRQALACALTLLVGCGAAASRPTTAASASPITPTPTPVNTPPRWDGEFELAADGRSARLVATVDAAGWHATLWSSTPTRGRCTLDEVAGTRTDDALGAHFECREPDESAVGESADSSGDTTVGLEPNGHLRGDFGFGPLDLSPSPRWPDAASGQAITIDAFVGDWYGGSVVADEDLTVTFRDESGALAGAGTFGFSGTMHCTFAEDRAARRPGRVRTHVACVGVEDRDYDFASDCTLAVSVDRSRITSEGCFTDIPLTRSAP